MNNFIDLNKEKKEKIDFNKSGKFIVFFHNLSGKFTFELNAEHLEVEIYGLYTGKEQDKFTVETIQHHNAPGTISNLLIKGVFEGESKFKYQGLIRIEKSGQESHAYQKNQNLILSPTVFIESEPYLEILANDVFCTHGSTTGKLNPEQLFYLKSRGIKEKRAESLLVDGFIQQLYDKVKEQVPQFNYSH